ncbi:MAG: ribosome small subunit-dependent GTPase A [Gemmatimonadetes bacterium 21-71-4]|nr:MAG: ribosome small subunit-dependent GTPase A [Gemmatimonadetes bacterium 21-71-4]
MIGTVTQGTGGVWRVRIPDGTEQEVSLRGRLKKSDTGRRAGGSVRRDTVAAERDRLKLAVGDRVRLERDARGQTLAIAGILPRTSRLARRAPGGGHGERVVAANMDQVVVVFAAANPEPHLRMIDRFLVIAEANGLPARLVVNKVDLVGPEVAHARFTEYPRAGYPVHFTSVKRGDGIEVLRRALAGRTSVLAGPSGTGKSSLINALYPGLNLRVGEISASVNKGRHTTVGASLHPLPGPAGGFVVDTPGLREVGMWELPVERLDLCFPEIRVHREQCRFADCRHRVEPDCEVRAAVERGEVGVGRYESYLKLAEEREERQAGW